MKKSKCCGAEIKYKKAPETSIYTMLYYCSKCGKPCDTIEEVQNELQIADDAIGHDVSGTESRQVQNEEKGKDKEYKELFDKIDKTDNSWEPNDNTSYKHLVNQPEKEWKEEGIGERRAKITQAINEVNKYSVIPMSEDIIIHLTDNLMGVFNQSIQSLLSQKDKEVEKAIKEEQNKLLLWWSNSTADNDYTRGFIDGIKEGLDSLSKLLKPTK
jgi:hypothetical protein